MRIVLATTAVLALATGAATAQQSARTGPAAPELAEGKAVYAHWCAPCHADSMGLAGTNSLTIKYEGTDIPGVLEDRTDLTAPVISYFVRNGIAWMPPFRRTEISDAELAALSAYLTAPLEDRGAHTPLLADEMAEMEAAR